MVTRHPHVVITDYTTLKRLGKKFNLTFDKKYKYCTSNAYNDDKGEPIPTYLVDGTELYTLQYESGCFNPYLIRYTGFIAYDKQTNRPLFPVDADKRQRVEELNPNLTVFKF